MANLNKIKEAFDRAGHVALTGTREQRSGRFMPVRQEKFLITLHKTYYNMGFFNIPVKYEHLFGSDMDNIDLFLNHQKGSPIIGHINRIANQNKTPRIIGTSLLKEWFQENCDMNENIEITVLSKHSILIETA